MAQAPPQIFHRKAYARARARALRRQDSFLAIEAAERLAERLATVSRHFTHALDLNSRPESFARLSPLADTWQRTALSPFDQMIAADEEALPFAEASFDLVVSVLSLHAVNDLPGALLQIRRALKPDGLFMAALFGGETLNELRDAFAHGESETRGGVSPRVAPFADVRALGSLLQRAGFALPVADSERTTVRYSEFGRLVSDLRDLGETNTLAARDRSTMPCQMLAAAQAHYDTHRVQGGKLTATFDIVYLLGWAPHESQPKALRPGSAKTRLATVLETEEHRPAGGAGSETGFHAREDS